MKHTYTHIQKVKGNLSKADNRADQVSTDMFSNITNSKKKRTIWSWTYSSMLFHSPLMHAHTLTQTYMHAHSRSPVVLPETPYVFPHTEEMKGEKKPFFFLSRQKNPKNLSSVRLCLLTFSLTQPQK